MMDVRFFNIKYEKKILKSLSHHMAKLDAHVRGYCVWVQRCPQMVV